ncbi:MAG: hypothetical protein Q4G43_11825 [Mobilicoccus sp.]|nr:hypothetical protein [Mobilicoccus sp.]
MRRRITASGRADIAEVWERYADLDRWSDWAPQIRTVDAPERRLRPGLCGIVRGPLATAVPFHIDAVDEETPSWTWTVTMLGASVQMHHDLTATTKGTTAGLTLDGPPPIALGYGPVARVALTLLCRR